MKQFLLLLCFLAPGYAFSSSQTDFLGRLLKEKMAQSGMKIKNIKMRTSYGFVAGGAAILMDTFGKFDKEFVAAGVDASAKRVTFEAQMGPQDMVYDCDIIFATGFDEGIKKGTFLINSCSVETKSK